MGRFFMPERSKYEVRSTKSWQLNFPYSRENSALRTSYF
jgi:hypothetical protein